MTDGRRRLPAVNALLAEAERAGLAGGAPRAVLVDAVRDALADARAAGGAAPDTGWLPEIERRLAARARRSLVRVVNGTGVVLHTNLGRAPLAEAAVRAGLESARYSALEYDLDTGNRGSRQRHTRPLVADLTGAEDALIVTNAAAAVLLTLSALARDGETIVSRGELVEIGGGFRIPDILAQSGSVLVEVGTTNRTRAADYERVVSPRTRCALKVHRSNFRLAGFVAECSIEELVSIMSPRGLPVVHDVGSGLLIDLSAWGLRDEPMPRDSVAAGATVVFSGDKLLGGPQAGIIAGRAEVIAQLAHHPLARALRPDKFTLGALEATLALYRDRDTALRDVPTLAMLTAAPATLKRRARRLARRIREAKTAAGQSSVGGGAFPEAHLPTTLVVIPSAHPDTFLTALRRHDPPVVARAGDGAVLVDPRTLRDDEFGIVAEAAAGARRELEP